MGHLKTLLFSIFLLIEGFIYGQNIPFKKDFFPHEVSHFKEALSWYKQGDDYFEKNNFYKALEFYEKARRFNAQNALLNYKIGVCYLNTDERYRCLYYFEKAFELDRNVSEKIHFFLARGYHLNSEFEFAINEYKLYLLGLSSKQKQEHYKAITRYIKQCNVGLSLLEKPARVIIEHLKVPLNSKYNDHSPFISADETLLYFTSTRKNNNVQEQDGQYDEDIYQSFKVGDEWNTPISLGEPVNTPFNDATVGLSPDGQNLLIYNGIKGGGDIQITYMVGQDWVMPRGLSKEINSEFRESSACFSPNGQKIYFVSNRPGGLGQNDIYVTEINNKGKWMPPVNLGKGINSPYNEETIFLHPNGRILYFSSDNEKSMGGFDVFKATLLDNGQWGEPENMGSPVNSPDDDLCFVISASGKHAYLSSVRPNSVGAFDIYKIIFLGPEKPLIFTAESHLLSTDSLPVNEMFVEHLEKGEDNNLTILKGKVVDDSEKYPLAAQLTIHNLSLNLEHQKQDINSSTGKFLAILPASQNFGVTLTNLNYMPYSERLRSAGSTSYNEIERIIELQPIKQGAIAAINNVFFVAGTPDLRPISFPELKQVARLVKQHPSLKIEIGIYTVSPDEATMDAVLAESRAKKIINYLRLNGVSSSTLTYKVYTEKVPQQTGQYTHSKVYLRVVAF